MKKNKAFRLPRHKWLTRRKRRKRTLISIVCVVMFLVFGATAGPFSSWTKSGIRTPFSSQAPPLPSPANPSKEYIYAGGRLIATEEPNMLAPPLNVAAGTFSATRIDISWDAAANAHHYVVERATQLGNFIPLNTNVTTNSYTDNTVTNLNAYLYRVKSADAAGNVSTGSNVDLATAITFEDDPFPSPPTQTLVRAQHILQLRQAVNAVRHLTPNLEDFAWTPSSLIPGTTLIKAKDIEDLRTALDQALVILNLPSGGYTDAELTGRFFQKLYITELRERVK